MSYLVPLENIEKFLAEAWRIIDEQSARIKNRQRIKILEQYQSDFDEGNSPYGE